MLTFSAFGTFESVCAEYVPHAEKIRVSSNDANLVFFLDSEQAVNLAMNSPAPSSKPRRSPRRQRLLR